MRLVSKWMRNREDILANGMTGSELGGRVERLLTTGLRVTRGASLATLVLIVAVLAGSVVVSTRSPAWVAFAQAPVAPTPQLAPVPPVPPVAPSPRFAPIPPPPPTSTLGRLLDQDSELERMRAQLAATEATLRAQQQVLEEQNKILQERSAALQRLSEAQMQKDRSIEELKVMLRSIERQIYDTNRR